MPYAPEAFSSSAVLRYSRIPAKPGLSPSEFPSIVAVIDPGCVSLWGQKEDVSRNTKSMFQLCSFGPQHLERGSRSWPKLRRCFRVGQKQLQCGLRLTAAPRFAPNLKCTLDPKTFDNLFEPSIINPSFQIDKELVSKNQHPSIHTKNLGMIQNWVMFSSSVR